MLQLLGLLGLILRCRSCLRCCRVVWRGLGVVWGCLCLVFRLGVRRRVCRGVFAVGGAGGRGLGSGRRLVRRCSRVGFVVPWRRSRSIARVVRLADS